MKFFSNHIMGRHSTSTLLRALPRVFHIWARLGLASPCNVATLVSCCLCWARVLTSHIVFISVCCDTYYSSRCDLQPVSAAWSIFSGLRGTCWREMQSRLCYLLTELPAPNLHKEEKGNARVCALTHYSWPVWTCSCMARFHGSLMKHKRIKWSDARSAV